MTQAEKLRFLADRIEDEKEFNIGYWVFKYQNEVLMEACDLYKTNSSFKKSHLLLDAVILYDLKPKQQKEKIQ